MGRIEDKILDILSQPELNEEVSYEVVGGPTPSATLKGPLDYAKNVQKAHVPQAWPIPGVGEIGVDDASKDEPITDGFGLNGMDEEEDDEKKPEDDDKDDDKDLDETFASLIAKLAEDEEDAAGEEKGDNGPDSHPDGLGEDEEGETSLDDPKSDFGNPDETLPDVDSKIESPDKLVSKAPGIKVAEEEGGDTSLDGDNGGTPSETLPDVDSMLDTPDKLTRPAVGAKTPNQKFTGDKSADTADQDDDKKSVSEDISALFAGFKLSEAAKAKATTIFKAAVARRVNEEKQRVQKVATKKLKEAFAVLKTRSEKKLALAESKMTGQVDNYLNYVVENWMKENRLAVERGIRAELAEDFIKGLKNLFVEHYIEVPESKVDVLSTLGKKVTTLEAKLNEAVESNVKMRASLNAYRKEEVVRAVSSGLADTQREKLKKLAEGVEYTTRKEFAQKLVDLKESYFPKKGAAKKEETLTEQTQQPQNTPAAPAEMDLYSKTISKMKKNN